MDEVFDIAIVGSGFAGSLLAMIARRLGHSVILLEKSAHPRFAIGESSTPLANLLLEELAVKYDLPRLLPLTKWGSWQRAYPQVACGLKRGFSFFHHQAGQAFENRADHSNQLLVAASPHDEIADTHWYRADFDAFLLQEARAMGAQYLDHLSLRESCWENDLAYLEGTRQGQRVNIRAKFVVDATGPRGFLHRALQLGEVQPANLPPTQALFTHFSGVRRLDEMGLDSREDTPPYPIDDAAVHHVIEGGWIWVLRFNNGLTSAGVAARDDIARELRLEEGAPAWERLLERFPTVRDQFAEAQPVFDFIHSPRLSFRSESVVGKGWALLPSAAGFVDPLLSTGFPLTLLGVIRLAEIIARDWGSSQFDTSLQCYEAQTLAELEAAEQMVSALYASMNDFPLFVRLSLLYFAAASYTETVRRLERPQMAGAFLLSDNPHFGPKSKSCFERARQNPKGQQRQQLLEEIERTIEPFDVAGLGDKSCLNWYGVEAADLFAAQEKLGVEREDLEALLVRAGFFAPSTEPA